jgi:hypothetical protein
MLLAGPAGPDDSDSNLLRHLRTNNLIQVSCAQFFQLGAPSLGLEDFFFQAWRAGRLPSPFASGIGALLLLFLSPLILNQIEETFERECPVPRLRPGILHRYREPTWAMPKSDCGRNFVDVLATWPGGPSEAFLKIGGNDSQSPHSFIFLHSLGKMPRYSGNSRSESRS